MYYDEYMAGKNVRFAQLLEIHVSNVITKKYVTDKECFVTSDFFKEVRETVKSTIEGVFAKSSHKLSTEAMVWLSDQYFKAIKINGAMMGEQVIINEYKLSSMPYSDIELMRNLFNESAIGVALEEEYRTRSQA